jgi:hypothetical protein
MTFSSVVPPVGGTSLSTFLGTQHWGAGLLSVVPLKAALIIAHVKFLFLARVTPYEAVMHMWTRPPSAGFRLQRSNSFLYFTAVS